MRLWYKYQNRQNYNNPVLTGHQQEVNKKIKSLKKKFEVGAALTNTAV